MRLRRRSVLLAGGAVALAPMARAQTFDPAHAAWTTLLKKHVVLLRDGQASQVRYDGFMADRALLKDYLDALSALPRSGFERFSKPQQQAFMINAYNAFTVELILTRWPELKSIKDIGSLLQSPWKKKFFTLLGEERTLDWIEHEQLRPRYREPRLHAALNCASIGCPALRNDAFTAGKLEAQLEDGMQRFMADRTRNRVASGKLEVSLIFKWFRDDFEQGHQGFNKLEDLFARYAVQLSDQTDEQRKLRDKALPVTFLDYDWSLNAVGR